LEPDSLEGVLSVEVSTASLGPEVVEEKAPEDVKRLAAAGEAARVVALEVRGVVFLFENSFPKKDEGPGDGEAVGRPPFIPGAMEGVPGLLGGGAIHEAVLRRLRDVLVVTFAGGLEPHGLEPRTHRETSIEGQLDEGTHFARAGIVLDPRHDLGSRGVLEIEALNEVDDFRGVVWLPRVLVASLGRVAEKGSIPHLASSLPVPVSGVPLEVGDESGSKDPVEEGFLTWEGEVFGKLEGGTVVVLGEYPDQLVPLQGYGDGSGSGGLDAARVGDSPEF
jgi:hypothetical protein